MAGRKMHSLTGELNYQQYGKEGEAIYSVSRGLLNQTLVHCAGKFENVHIYFDQICKDLDVKTNTLEFENPQTGEVTSQQFDRIF
jgi:kynurenine 3-monooxygenase